jgi:hypothetical protein
VLLSIEDVGVYLNADGFPDREPAYDPGFKRACPVCGRFITKDDVRTSCLASANRKEQPASFFYRLHRTCDNDASPKTIEAIDLACIELGAERVRQLLAARGMS